MAAGVYGDFGALKVDTGSGYTPLYCTTGIGVNRQRESARVDCQGDPNKAYRVGKPDFRFTSEGMYDPASTALFTALDSDAAIDCQISPDTTADPGQVLTYTGDMILEGFEMSIRQDAIITMSVNGLAAGTIVTAFA